MTTSPHRTDSAEPRSEPEYAAPGPDNLSFGPDSVASQHDRRYLDDPPEGYQPALAGPDEVQDGPGQRVGEYEAMPGLPARGVIVTSLVAASGCAAADLLLTGALTMFFDLCFIVVCLISAMAVRRRDFFTTGVLPPLLFAAVVALLAVRNPGTFVQVGGLGKAFMTGLAEHAAALVTGYAIALAALACRASAGRLR